MGVMSFVVGGYIAPCDLADWRTLGPLQDWIRLALVQQEVWPHSGESSVVQGGHSELVLLLT